jgi:hypothetical protein
MKIFDIIDFIVFVEKNDDVYFNESYGELKQIVNENGSGVYSLMYGSRSEVEFKKVNLVDELLEWKQLQNSEFKDLVGGWNENELDRENDYLELIFDEEDFRYYFIITK